MANMPDELKVSIPMQFKVEKQFVLPQWEYKYIPRPSVETLNAHGAEGWQVALYVPPTNEFLMIREIPPAESDPAHDGVN